MAIEKVEVNLKGDQNLVCVQTSPSPQKEGKRTSVHRLDQFGLGSGRRRRINQVGKGIEMRVGEIMDCKSLEDSGYSIDSKCKLHA